MTGPRTSYFQALWSRDQWADLPVYRSTLTPLLFLERTLHVFPEKIGIVDGMQRLTYGEFGARVYRLASALRNHGVEKGDRVAVLCRNATEILEAHFGVPQLGAILVPINVRLSSEEIAYILNHSGAKTLILDTALCDLVTPIQTELSELRSVLLVDLSERHSGDVPREAAWGGNVTVLDYEEFLAEGRPEPFVHSIDDEDHTISINYTSGTTGRPKGVMYTHRGAYLNALGELFEVGLDSAGVYLWTLPMYHCNGWCFTWAVTGAGGTNICLPQVDPAQIFELIKREGVTHFCGAPTVLIMLTADQPQPGYRFSHELTVVTAAAPPPPAIIQRVEEMGARLIHVYGLTETYGPHTVCEWKAEWDDLSLTDRARFKARQGVGYIHAPELRVVDEQMRDVPADGSTMGEVVMRGNNVMKGYYRNPEATAQAFAGDWFHSGDLGVMHPDGYIELRDRKKDIIISGGENISSIEVERVLYQHPAVLEATVIGIPHEKWGEVPKAFVVTKAGTSVSAQALIDFCREHMAHFKCPKAVELVDALPKTSTGKVQKFVLREKEWAGYKKRIH